MDAVADTDQRKEAAKHLAQVIAAFYCELVKEGVPMEEAGWLARDHADALRETDEE